MSKTAPYSPTRKAVHFNSANNITPLHCDQNAKDQEYLLLSSSSSISGSTSAATATTTTTTTTTEIPIHFGDESANKTTITDNEKTVTDSLSFPLLAERAGIKFKLGVLFITLVVALLIGLAFSIILVTQLFNNNHYRQSLSEIMNRKNQHHSTLLQPQHITATMTKLLTNSSYLFETILKNKHKQEWINDVDFTLNPCDDFYAFSCRKWLHQHPLSALEFKRSWLTERSKQIRTNFAKTFLDFSSSIYDKLGVNMYDSHSGEHIEDEIKSQTKNELEQFYTNGEYDGDDINHGDTYYKIIQKRMSQHDKVKKSAVSTLQSLTDMKNNEWKNVIEKFENKTDEIEEQFARSIVNMASYYHQCFHTSESVLLQQLKQLANERFWFAQNTINHLSTKNDDLHYQYLFEQMQEHSLLKVWRVNSINIETQTIIHIERQIHPQKMTLDYIQPQLLRASIFEHYVKTNQIDLCYQSKRVGPLTKTINEYFELIQQIDPLNDNINSSSSISEDLRKLSSGSNQLSIIYSSVRKISELRDILQFMTDKVFNQLNITFHEDLFQNFTNFLIQSSEYRSVTIGLIVPQCRSFLHYYIQFRSLVSSNNINIYSNINLIHWLDYISQSIINILRSWPGDMYYTCLYSTMIRTQQLQTISYWNEFIIYIKQQHHHDHYQNGTKNFLSHTPIYNIELRLLDFFYLDSIFRFLFADNLAHYCNIQVYKYGPKLLPFVSIKHEGIQISLKSLWKQLIDHPNNKQQIIYDHYNPRMMSDSRWETSPLELLRIPNDCLSIVELYYPWTLSSLYDYYMKNKTNYLHSVALSLKENLINDIPILIEKLPISSINIDDIIEKLLPIDLVIIPERLKLFKEHFNNDAIYPFYEYYHLEDMYLSTAWNLIEKDEQISTTSTINHIVFEQKSVANTILPSHEFFEINGHHSNDQIFLQPTIGELLLIDENDINSQISALFIIGHELGHAFWTSILSQIKTSLLCSCNLTGSFQETMADLIGLHLSLDYFLNTTMITNNNYSNSDLYKLFFLSYGHIECSHINSEMTFLNEDVTKLQVNNVLENELFFSTLNCTSKIIYHTNVDNSSFSWLNNICNICKIKT